MFNLPSIFIQGKPKCLLSYLPILEAESEILIEGMSLSNYSRIVILIFLGLSIYNASLEKMCTVSLHHRLYVCDVPAEKLVLNFKSSGFYSDTLCDIEGETVNNGSVVYFP